MHEQHVEDGAGAVRTKSDPTMGVDGERTASPRVSIRLPVRISTIDPEADPFTGKSFFRTSEESSANLSGGGVFVAMRETIPPGRRVLVELEMPGGRSLQTLGRVAWTRARVSRDADAPAGTEVATGVGIEFLGGPRDDLQQLERFVKRALRRRRADAGGTSQDIAPGS